MNEGFWNGEPQNLNVGLSLMNQEAASQFLGLKLHNFCSTTTVKTYWPEIILKNSHKQQTIWGVSMCAAFLSNFLTYICIRCSLTPVYMIIIGFLASLFVYIGDGPLWPYVDPTHDWYDSCKNHWWTNLLYVNNIVHADLQVWTTDWNLGIEFSIPRFGFKTYVIPESCFLD